MMFQWNYSFLNIHRSTTYDPFLDLSLSVDDTLTSESEPVGTTKSTSNTSRSDCHIEKEGEGKKEEFVAAKRNKTIQDCFEEFTTAEELHQSMVLCEGRVPP